MTGLFANTMFAGALTFALAGHPALGRAQTSHLGSADSVVTFAPMLERVMSSVVSITASSTRKKPVPISELAQVASSVSRSVTKSMTAEERTTEGGSGIIVDVVRGLIYTNQHVVKNATEVTVKLANGRELVGKVLGADIGADIAVVQIEPMNLTAAPFGNSDKLRVGDLIFIAGSPYGLAGTAKMGMVSALMRSDVAPEIFEDFVQIDAIINPGNSGGAMFNSRGELCGVVAASVGAAGETAIGFVIPINMARSIADQIVAGGMVHRGSVGFAVQSLTQEWVKKLDLPFAHGAAITAIVPGSPAEKTGFKEWDVIISVDGRDIHGASDYTARIASIPVGRMVELDIRLKATGEMKRTKLAVADLTIEPKPMPAPADLKSLKGLTLGMLLPGSPDWGKVRGARVLAISDKTPAARLGLARDDIITRIDTDAVGAPEDAFSIAQMRTKRYRVQLSRGGQSAYIDVTP